MRTFSKWVVVTHVLNEDLDIEELMYINNDIEMVHNVNDAKTFKTKDEAQEFSDRAEQLHCFEMSIIQIDSVTHGPHCGSEGIFEDFQGPEHLLQGHSSKMTCSDSKNCDVTWEIQISLKGVSA